MLGYLYVNNVCVKITAMHLNYIKDTTHGSNYGADWLFDVDFSENLVNLKNQLEPLIPTVIHGLTVYKNIDKTEVLWSANFDCKIHQLAEFFDADGDNPAEIGMKKELSFILC